jgi:deoxyadenosine/deoxycytidine kinase
MPTYEFVNTKTQKIEEHTMSVSAYDEFKADNPHLERYYSDAPMFSYTGGGDFAGKKTDNTWKEVMSKIAEQNPRSPLADNVLKKSTKRVKTDQVLKKHNVLQR